MSSALRYGYRIWRSFRVASVSSVAMESTQRGSEVAVEVARDREAILKTAVEKIKTLALSHETLTDAAPLLTELSQAIRRGTVTVRELIDGAQRGHITQRDVRTLVQLQAVQPSIERHIKTILHGGTPLLSLTEAMELLRNRFLGKADLIQILQNGDLTLAEMEYLTEKDLLPRDVLEVVKAEFQTIPARTNIPVNRFSKIQSMLAAQQMGPMQLTSYVLKGDLHPDDLSLLVSENLLSEKEADAILESCASEVAGIYEEAEKLAELVGNGRFSYEELEVMRAKGVLGDALIHYLTHRNAVDEEKAQRLMHIEPDVDYIDPEITDDEGSTGVAKEASDDGFYPAEIDRGDIFALWEHLGGVYADRPGGEETYELIQDTGPSIGLKQLPKADLPESSLPSEQLPEVDADGNVLAVGKRKSSVAYIKLKAGTGSITINHHSFYDYFPKLDARCYVLSPFLVTDTLGQFDAEVVVEGGGWSGQAQAVRHGLARALLQLSSEHGSALQEVGLLKRDPRMVERKKPGRAKARKSFQWVKR